MTRHGITPMIGLALLLSAGCGDSAQDDEVWDDAARTDDVVRVSTDELQQDMQSALDEFGDELDELDRRYETASDDVADGWSATRAEMREFREGLEADLVSIDGVGGDEARDLRQEMAGDLESLTERLERAKLEAIEDDWEFLAASRDRMATLEEELRTLGSMAVSLPEEAREDASERVADLRSEATELEARLDGLTDVTAEEISDRRDDIAQEVGELAASVRREMFEIRHVEPT